MSNELAFPAIFNEFAGVKIKMTSPNEFTVRTTKWLIQVSRLGVYWLDGFDNQTLILVIVEHIIGEIDGIPVVQSDHATSVHGLEELKDLIKEHIAK